jgi:aryl sulfotransferase
MLIEAAQREYRTWIVDSRRWQGYRPRAGDIIIATYPKCGTTWTQRIVSLLVFQTTEPRPVMEISAWVDRRIGEPIETMFAAIEAQPHRRFLKSHLPLDGLPLHDEVRYIHVARDGRDVAMSYHNHCTGFSQPVLERLDRAGLEDETIGRPYPRAEEDPAEFFRRWVAGEDGRMMCFFHTERTWWEARKRPNVLLVHYNDLKADLSGEMRRIADFLDIEVEPALWPDLVGAAGFAAMRRDGDALMGRVTESFQGGSRRFFHQGRNGRWQGVVRDADLALYRARTEAELPRDCAHWLGAGRCGGDPRQL